MGTYGTATGIVIVTPAANAAGRILGLNAGELQAYFDADGMIKAAGGKIQLDREAIKFIGFDTGTAGSLEFQKSGGNVMGRMYVADLAPVAVDAGFTIISGTGERCTMTIGADGGATDSPYASVRLSAQVKGKTAATLTLQSNMDGTKSITVGANVDMATWAIQNLADAISATDALNRQTGDARYAPIAGAHAAVTLDANADTLLSLSTQTLGLDTKTANYIFAGPTTGAAAVPTFRAMVQADLPATALLTDGTRAGATSGPQKLTSGAILGTPTGMTTTGNLLEINSRGVANAIYALPAAFNVPHIFSYSGNVAGVWLEGINAANYVTGRSAGGSYGSPSAWPANNAILTLEGRAHDGTSFSGAQARIRLYSAEAFTTTARGTHITFHTTPLSSTTMAEVARINSTGSLLLGTTTDGMTAGGSLAVAQDLAHRGTKAGLYNVTPVARATTSGSAATFVQNSGNAVNDASTFDGYTLNQVVLALRNIGILT